MSLYAIGDFHLSFTVNKPMDVFDKRWKNHVVKIEKYWKKKVTENDTVVITGDHSWGRDLAECQADLDFIMALPGRKILLRGNHDMFWDAKKTENLNEMFRGKLEFLQNNFYTYEDYALVGTKGYCYEGKDSYEHFLKIRERELGRLRCSFEGGRIREVYHVSPLSANQYWRNGESVYPDGTGIWRREGNLFSLSWRETV